MHWIGYISVSLVATLLVLVMAADIIRSSYWLISGVVLLTSGAHLTAIHSAAFYPQLLLLAMVMSVVGLIQARRPRIRRVEIG